MCPIGHNLPMDAKVRIIEYYTTAAGKQPALSWLSGIKDSLAQAILYKRIQQAGLGNFGKTRNVGNGVNELKIDYGPGYRVYFGVYQDELILLLVGGTKRTQHSDIEKARDYWAQWQKEKKLWKQKAYDLKMI